MEPGLGPQLHLSPWGTRECLGLISYIMPTPKVHSGTSVTQMPEVPMSSCLISLISCGGSGSSLSPPELQLGPLSWFNLLVQKQTPRPGLEGVVYFGDDHENN